MQLNLGTLVILITFFDSYPGKVLKKTDPAVFPVR